MESTRFFIERYNNLQGYWVRYDRAGDPIPSYKGSCRTVEEARKALSAIKASHNRAGRNPELRIVQSVIVTTVVS